jgi:hypothetical protein
MKTVMVQMIDALHSRVRRVANRTGTSMSQLIRDGLDAHLRAIEQRERGDIDARRAARERNRASVDESIRSLDRAPVEHAVDDITAVFNSYARRFVSADRAGDPKAAERTQRECREVLKKEFPLTFPWDKADEFDRQFMEAVKRVSLQTQAPVRRNSDDDDDDGGDVISIEADD